MFKVGSYVVYKREVCKIKEIKDEYYILSPMYDKSLTINIPVSNKNGFIRDLISKNKVEEIINSIPSVKEIECSNEKSYEYEYKTLLADGTYESLIKIIKTTYLNNKEREINNKKMSQRDDDYFKKSERILYNEFSIVLGIDYDSVKEYVKNRVEGSII